jgi:hypothetical protein
MTKSHSLAELPNALAPSELCVPDTAKLLETKS